MNALILRRRKSARPGKWLALFTAFLGTFIHQHAVAEPIGAILETRSEFSIFARALRQSGLLGRLKTDGRFVLFAVSDQAMEEEGSSFLLNSVLVAPLNEERLVTLMSYHVVPALGLLPDGFTHPVQLETLASTCLSVSRVGQRLQVGPEAFVAGAISADNGTIYALDRLLWQPWQGGKRCGGPHNVRWEGGQGPDFRPVDK